MSAKSLESTALRLLATKAYSVEALRQKLLAKQFAAAEIEELLDAYQAKGYLNDAEYASAFARTQQKLRYLAPRSIAMELKKRGIAQQHTDSALEGYDSELQLETAIKLLRTRWQRMADLDAPVRGRRAASLLARRGFSSSISIRAIAQVEAEG